MIQMSTVLNHNMGQQNRDTKSALRDHGWGVLSVCLILLVYCNVPHFTTKTPSEFTQFWLALEPEV